MVLRCSLMPVFVLKTFWESFKYIEPLRVNRVSESIIIREQWGNVHVSLHERARPHCQQQWATFSCSYWSWPAGGAAVVRSGTQLMRLGGDSESSLSTRESCGVHVVLSQRQTCWMCTCCLGTPCFQSAHKEEGALAHSEQDKRPLERANAKETPT